MDFDLTGFGQGGHLQRRVDGIETRHQVFHGGFRQSRYFQRFVEKISPAEWFETGKDMNIEHGFELMGRAGEKNDALSVPLKPLAWRCPEFIRQDLGAFEAVSLLSVGGGQGEGPRL